MGGGSPHGASTKVRLRALLVSAAVLAATVVPLTWPTGQDDFPLTPYPMFARERPDASVVLVVALGEGTSGTVVLPTEATGHRQLTQAARALADAVGAGGDRPARLCDEIAHWVYRSELDDLTSVRIVTAAYDGIGYLLHDLREPEIRAEHAVCEVGP